MRIFLIAFILALTTLGVSEGENECPRFCHGVPNPICGHDLMCNYEAANWCVINNEECWRRHRNMPRFMSVSEGACPYDKPICPSSEIPIPNTGEDTPESPQEVDQEGAQEGAEEVPRIYP